MIYGVTVRAIVEQYVEVEADGPREAKRKVEDARTEGYGPQYAGELSEGEWCRWWVAWDQPAEVVE